MQKRTTIVIALAIGTLAVILPLLAALYLAQRQGMEKETQDALTVAREIVRRGELIGTRANAALNRLLAKVASDPCSEAAIALMRDLSLDSGYLPVLGHVEDGRLACSSLGHHGEGLALGPVAHETAHGARIRRSVNLGFAGDVRFLALEKDGFIALVHPGVAMGVVVDRPDTAIGVYTLSNRRPMIGRGDLRPAWLTKLHDARQVSFSDGDYVVGIARSREFDAAAYAAIPTAHLDARVRALAAILLPIGLLLGAGMAVAILHLARQQMSLPALLRKALKEEAFALHYQPIVELASGRMVGAEALLRWPRPEGRHLRPDLFIPVAEDCGLIEQLTGFVLARIAEEAPRFFEANPECYISVNLAAADLQSEGTVALLSALIESPGIHAHNILAEVTEHSFLDADRAKYIINQIRALGIRVAIDDFGTGYSSLSHLTTLKLDYLKIDKAFVETVGTDSATSEVALHIIRMAQSLGMTIIAEGVETEVQAAFLREHGVACGQGWLFGQARPMAQLMRRSP